MTKEQALALLNCPLSDQDDLQDALEQEVHQLKQPFLNRFVPPKLVEAKMRKLEKLIDAKKALNLKTTSNMSYELENSNPYQSKIPEFMRWHLTQLYTLKKHIANNYDPESLLILLTNYLQLQLEYKTFWKGDYVNTTIELQTEPEYKTFIENNYTDQLINYERNRVSKF